MRAQLSRLRRAGLTVDRRGPRGLIKPDAWDKVAVQLEPHAQELRRMAMRLAFIVALLLTIVPATNAAFAATDGKRFALVIGNARYPDSDAPLKEPVSDARAMGEELKRSSFEVTVGENLSREAMRRMLETFYGKIQPGCVALLFFSGYGIQSGRQSYMIPVDGQLWTEADVRRDGFSLETVLSEINSRGASVKIAILDASRRNPFERRFRSFSAGLAPVTAPRGTLVMYSAAPSTVVNDAATDRSLFVGELLKEIRVPGFTAEEALNRTRVGVSRASQGEQVPWFSSSLAEEFSFGPPGSRVQPTPVSVPPEPRVTPPEPKILPPEPRPLQTPTPSFNDIPKPPPPLTTPAPAPPPPVAAPAPAPADPLANDPAIRELTNLLAGNPNDSAAFYKRGQIYASKGAYAQALRDFNEAIRLNPTDVEALNNRCWVRSIMGELQPALKDCNDALKLRPNFVDALDSRGLVYLKLGNNTPAIADFDAALRLNPKLASSLYGRGIARNRSGGGGDRDISTAKSLDPNIVNEFAGYGIR